MLGSKKHVTPARRPHCLTGLLEGGGTRLCAPASVHGYRPHCNSVRCGSRRSGAGRGWLRSPLLHTPWRGAVVERWQQRQAWRQLGRCPLGRPSCGIRGVENGLFFVELYWAAFLGCASGRHILSHVQTQLLRHGPRLTEHVAAAAAPGRCAPAPNAGIQLTGLFVRIGRQNRL